MGWKAGPTTDGFVSRAGTTEFYSIRNGLPVKQKLQDWDVRARSPFNISVVGGMLGPAIIMECMKVTSMSHSDDPETEPIASFPVSLRLPEISNSRLDDA